MTQPQMLPIDFKLFSIESAMVFSSREFRTQASLDLLGSKIPVINAVKICVNQST